MQNKPEFQLAMTIFVAISIFGTAFGLWWASHYAHVQPRTNTNPAQESAAPPPAPNTAPAVDPNKQ